MTATTVTIIEKNVWRNPANGMYVVRQRQLDGNWLPASKEYAHSTSAFAALGRLVQKEIYSENFTA